MKKILLIFSLLAVVLSCRNRNSNSGDVVDQDKSSAPYMYFREDEQDHGKVKQGDTVFATFLVQNRGKSDLLIKRVSPSCGCTVAKYEEKPIAPGKYGSIKLIFATHGREGRVSKSATVYSNARPETKVLTFKCEIVSPNNKSK
ncbi:MAG TPA: DUF1573 domain-containing protein [Bacteroidales bacterium]